MGTLAPMDADVTPMIFMIVILKIPIVFLCWLVYWAWNAKPETVEAPDGGGGNDRFGRFRREPKRPRGPRRGPHSPSSLPLPCPDEGSVRVGRGHSVERPRTATAKHKRS